MDRTLATCRFKTYRPILARQFVFVQLRRTRDIKFAVLDAWLMRQIADRQGHSALWEK
jgi:hypothetical protein